MLRKTSLLLVLGLLTAGSAASAQDYDDDDRGSPPDNPPPAGADVAYDYLNHSYYRYDGPPPQAPAAREQRGYRDGHTEREPLTGYYAGVRLVYPYHRWGYGCGCYSGRGYHYRDRYAGDDLDTQDYGRFSYNYSTRRYTDHHVGGWAW